MSNEKEGAKEARRTIKRFQEHINSPRLVPDQCYRMSSSTYPLVGYVNQITGLYTLLDGIELTYGHLLKTLEIQRNALDGAEKDELVADLQKTA